MSFENENKLLHFVFSWGCWLYNLENKTENENDRTSFSKYYKPKIEIKDFNLLTKNKEESYELIIEMERNNDNRTGNLLDYGYFSTYYKLIAVEHG